MNTRPTDEDIRAIVDRLMALRPMASAAAEDAIIDASRTLLAMITERQAAIGVAPNYTTVGIIRPPAFSGEMVPDGMHNQLTVGPSSHSHIRLDYHGFNMAHPASPDAVRDAERFQFMLDECCSVQRTGNDYWLWWPMTETVQEGSFNSAREAIDAAKAARENKS